MSSAPLEVAPNIGSYNDGVGDTRYMGNELGSNHLRSFVSQQISRKKAIPLRRSDDRTARSGDRYSGNEIGYGKSNASKANSYPSREPKQNYTKETVETRVTTRKEDSDSEEDDYGDDDFDDYNDDDFDDISDEDTNKDQTKSQSVAEADATFGESKTSYLKKQKKSDTSLRFPTSKLNDDTSTGNLENRGASKHDSDYGSKTSNDQFALFYLQL